MRAWALAGLVSCAGASTTPATTHRVVGAPEAFRVVHEAGRPPLGVIVREGDPTDAASAFVSTLAIAPARRGVVETSLAAVFAARLPDARVTPQAGGVRVVVVSHHAADDLGRLATALRASVSDDELAVVKRKLLALASLPTTRPELSAVDACLGTLTRPADTSMPTLEDVEHWRAAAIANELVGFGIVGHASAGLRTPALPTGALASVSVLPDELTSYDAQDGSVDMTWRGDARLLAVARALGTNAAPLRAMLAARDSSLRLRSVQTGAGADGVCLALHADVDRVADVGSFVALASREVQAAMVDGSAADVGHVLAGDVSDAAAQAAILALATLHEANAQAPRVVVGLAPGASREDAQRSIDAAKRAFGGRVVESRVRTEIGQPASWALLASPCGTTGEADGDAGASAVFAVAVARALRKGGIDAEPWIAADGVGVIASSSDARALGDALGRAWLVDPLDEVRAAQGHLMELLRPALSRFAQAMAPGMPATLLPTGTASSLLSLSEATVIARAEALRHGPLRGVFIGDRDGAADALAQRVDRWAPRDLGSTERVCPVRATAQTPKPGTYAIVTDDGSSEAYLAVRIPVESEVEARVLAGVLDGEGGLLQKALADGLARSYGARVLGPAGDRSLVVHVEAPVQGLDVAVAQTRALLDRVRQGAFAEADLDLAKQRGLTARAARLADPRERLVAVFRGEPDVEAPPPPLDHIRAVAAAILHDDALVIVAARPPLAKSRTP